MASNTYTGGLIRRVLSRGARVKVWGNHDNLLIRTSDGRMAFGNVAPWRAKLLPLVHFEARMNWPWERPGAVRLRVFELPELDERIALRVGIWWEHNIEGTIYDFGAFPRLWWKNTFFDLSESRWPILRRIGNRWAGHEWRDWCTEANWRAFASQGLFPIGQKSNPTPCTFEKYWSLKMREVTHEVIRDSNGCSWKED